MIEKDLGQIIPDITATATIDNTEGVPSVSVTVDELNELNRLVRKFNFAFLHLKGEKGDKPVKGIDYLTEEEKQQFTTETLGLVTSEGNKQIEAVGNKGTEQAGKVTSEGSKQITLVSGEANKVITQLKELIAGNPDTSNAQALSGKSRIEFERDTQALAGKYAGNFPLTSAVKDAVYLVPATGKFYVCTQAYNGSNLTAPNANFEEMSVWANRDKLGNLNTLVQTHKIDSNDFKGEIYEFNSFYLFRLLSNTAMTSNETKVITHNLNINIPLSCNFIPIVSATGNGTGSRFAILKQNTIEIMAPGAGINPTIYLYAFAPKLNR